MIHSIDMSNLIYIIVHVPPGLAELSQQKWECWWSWLLFHDIKQTEKNLHFKDMI